MSLPLESNFLLNALPLLLHDHDCLVIPELGGFVAHPVPAQFDGEKGEWIPPGRNVAFNPKLTVRDGLLEQEIRRSTGCTNDAARALIDRDVQSLKEALAAEGQIELGGLGRLYAAEDGRLGFAPEARLSERYAAPGLSRIPWFDKEAQPVEDVPHPATEDTPTVVTPLASTDEGQETAGMPLRWAAVLLLPLLVGGALWWNGQPGTAFNLIDGLSSPKPAEFLPRIEGEDIRFPELTVDAPLPFVSENAPAVEPDRAADTAEPTMPVPRPQPTSSGCSHHVIAGTFGEAPRAAELARRFEALGYSSAILPGPNGMQRVSAGCFDNADDAARFKSAIQAHHGFEQAWVLPL